MQTRRIILFAITALLGILPTGASHAGGDLPPQEPPYYDEPEPYLDEPPSMRAAAQACGRDIDRYCRGIPPGGGRIISCLAGNRDRLTPACEDVLRRAEQFFRR